MSKFLQRVKYVFDPVNIDPVTGLVPIASSPGPSNFGFEINKQIVGSEPEASFSPKKNLNVLGYWCSIQGLPGARKKLIEPMAFKIMFDGVPVNIAIIRVFEFDIYHKTNLLLQTGLTVSARSYLIAEGSDNFIDFDLQNFNDTEFSLDNRQLTLTVDFEIIGG